MKQLHDFVDLNLVINCHHLTYAGQTDFSEGSERSHLLLIKTKFEIETSYISLKNTRWLSTVKVRSSGAGWQDQKFGGPRRVGAGVQLEPMRAGGNPIGPQLWNPFSSPDLKRWPSVKDELRQKRSDGDRPS
jgi:hypothetical protein